MESHTGLVGLEGYEPELNQKNQGAHPKDAQGSACCTNRSQLEIGLRLYV
jgi:hypothetical protein